MPSQREYLLNAFTPAREVTEPEEFAGRQQQVRDLADALQIHGSCPMIYGDRGLGKSSLALQGQLIAMGGDVLLRAIGALDRIIPEDSGFLTFYLSCTEQTNDVQSLVQTLINAAENVDFSATVEQKTTLVDRTSRRKLAIKPFELEATKKYQVEKSRESYKSLSVEEKFQHLSSILIDTYDCPLLFIIDELDKLQDKRGLASFIKSASSDRLKFLLVGIAQNVSDLLYDHLSLERVLKPIRVPPMTKAELLQSVEHAEQTLRQSQLRYTFSEDARTRLVNSAAGFPWFVHVIGQAALLAAAEIGRNVVNADMIVLARRKLINLDLAQQFRDAYQNAVRDSVQRERVLRSFASWPDPDIPTGEVYRVLKNQLNVTNPSVYKGHLASEQFGQVLITPQFQQQGLVRFRSEMFKVYVQLRPSIYEGVAEEVARAFAV